MFDVQKKINYSSPTGITAPGTNSKKSNIQSKYNIDKYKKKLPKMLLIVLLFYKIKTD